jgi:peptidoglycan hydrolase-like protein with peptidoglycan-binding domain
MFATLGSTGGTVAALHDRLVILGVAVPGLELRDDRFGPGTEAALRQVQSEAGIPVTGALDEATAVALGLAIPKSITGLVCGPDGAPFENVRVRLATGLNGETLVAETKSGSDGTFTIPWPERIPHGLSSHRKFHATTFLIPTGTLKIQGEVIKVTNVGTSNQTITSAPW